MCRLVLPEVRRLERPEDQIRIAYEAVIRADGRRNRLLGLLQVLGLPTLGCVIAVVAAMSCGVSNFIAALAFGLLGMTLVYAGVLIVWGHSHRPALRDVMAEHGYPICRKCGDDRTGLQPAALCPECGSAPPDADVQRAHSEDARVWSDPLQREPSPDRPRPKHRRAYIVSWFIVLGAITWMSYAAPRPAGPGWYASFFVALVVSLVLAFKISRAR